MKRYYKKPSAIIMEFWGTGYEESEQFKRYVKELALDYTGHDPRLKHQKTTWIASNRLIDVEDNEVVPGSVIRHRPDGSAY